MFAGRDAELARLDELATGGARLAIAVISGVGGVGKSALACRWAHRMSDQYPDGVLYTELAGHTPSDATVPEIVLTGFLLALGMPPESVPQRLEEQASHFRSLTAGRRLLLVLDNAASAAQVRVLLPGLGTSVVLVTTRWHLAGLALEGASFLELGPLEETAAAEVIGAMAGSRRAETEPTAIREIARLCGGLPLAVCVAGAQLAMRARHSPSRLAAELAVERDRLARLSLDSDVSVHAAFDVSYRVLPEDAAGCYRMLSLAFTIDFGVGLAAALVGTEENVAATLLEVLVGASLLQEVADQRYRFHDLVRLHAMLHAEAESPGEIAAAKTRAVDWYLRQAALADRALLPNRTRLMPAPDGVPAAPTDALAWLELELAGIVAAIHVAHDSELHEDAWSLCDALWGLFTHRKHYSQWIDAHLTGVASAIARADSRAESVMRVRLGIAYLQSGRLDDAIVEFGAGLAAARRGGNRAEEASALEHVGLAELALGHPDKGAECFRTAASIFEEVGRPRGVMLMTRRLGEAYKSAGQRDQAVSFLRRARSLAQSLGEPYHEMRALSDLADAHGKAGELGEAMAVLGDALGIAERIGARHEQAQVLVALGNTELALGHPGAASDHFAAARLLTEVQEPS
jgi:tetratricopeptide (TPR) repeat protein